MHILIYLDLDKTPTKSQKILVQYNRKYISIVGNTIQYNISYEYDRLYASVEVYAKIDKVQTAKNVTELT